MSHALSATAELTEAPDFAEKRLRQLVPAGGGRLDTVLPVEGVLGEGTFGNYRQELFDFLDGTLSECCDLIGLWSFNAVPKIDLPSHAQMKEQPWHTDNFRGAGKDQLYVVVMLVCHVLCRVQSDDCRPLS